MTISFSGLASGLDTSTWIDALTSLKRAKVSTLQQKQQTIVYQRDTLANVKSFFSSFKTTVEKLTDSKFSISTMDLFVQNLASSSDTSKLTATADTTAEEKTYTVKIDKIADNTEARSNFSTKVTTRNNASGNSLLNTLSLNDGSINSGTAEILVNGVTRSISIDSNETVNSFIEKLNNIGVNAFFDDNTGKLHMDVSLSDINDGETNLKQAFHLTGVNEGYFSDKLQYKTTVTNSATATANTKLSSLGTGISFDNKDDQGYESINITNSSGESSVIKVNEDSTIGDIIDGLTNAGLYAKISNSGILEVSGGVITGGTFDIASIFGLSEDTSSAMVICNSLTTITSNPDVVDLQTKLVEDLGATRGYYKVTTDNGNNYYNKIYAGMTIADLMTDLDNLGVSTSLDTVNGTLSISGGSLTQLNDDEVRALSSNSTIQENDETMKKASNFLTSASYTNGTSEINFNNVYEYNNIEPPSITIGAITSDTKLADIITEDDIYEKGFITVQKDGIQYDISLGEQDTFQSLMDTLSIYGFDSVINDKGELIIQTTGNSRIQAYSNSENASNILDILGANSGDWVFSNSYTSNALNVITTEEQYIDANENTVLSDIVRSVTSDDYNNITSTNPYNENFISNLNGNIEIVVDGVVNNITISSDDSIGTILDKFRSLGMEAGIENGKIYIDSKYKDLSINTPQENGSSIVSSGLLNYNPDKGGYISSTESVISTVTVGEDLSASSWADLDTKLSALNITTGTLSVYKDGCKSSVYIEKDDTFASIQEKINSDLDKKYGEGFGDIQITFEHGYLTMYSTSGKNVTRGASTDSSNFASITGSHSTEDGKVISARELYKINVGSKITDTGLFRNGDITEGDFVIGDQTITIDSNTTLNDIISTINGYNESVSAYWDTLSGQLILQSKLSGSMFVNVEAGSSNFTDVLGFTSSERDSENNILSTTLNTDTQKTGSNAIFYINGTMYTSNSNTVNSDISRIDGVTLNLRNITEGEEIILNVKPDTETVSNAVEDMVNAYNELIEAVDNVITANGTLSDQTTLKMIRNQIKSYMTSSLSSSPVYRNLDAIGISVDAASGGNISTSSSTITKLTFNKDKFASAYANDGAALKYLLVGDNVNDGILNKIENLLEDSLKGVNGYFDAQASSYNTQIKQLSEQMTKANKQIISYQSILENKFSTMDMLISNMQQQYSSFLAT